MSSARALPATAISEAAASTKSDNRCVISDLSFAIPGSTDLFHTFVPRLLRLGLAAAQISLEQGTVRKKRLGLTLADYAAEFDHVGSVGEFERTLCVLLDEKYRNAALATECAD